MERVKDQIANIVQDVLTREGCELAEVQVSKYKNNATVKLFVYAENGVSLYKCAHLSHLVRDTLDASDLFESGFALEISSPGLDRPLTTALDFKYRVGETVRIDFVDRSRQQIIAAIVVASDDTVVFRNEDGEFRIDLGDIERARIVF